MMEMANDDCDNDVQRYGWLRRMVIDEADWWCMLMMWYDGNGER